MTVRLGLSELEAVELEYTIKYRIRSLTTLSGGCFHCQTGEYDPKKVILETILQRLQDGLNNLFLSQS